VPCSFDINGDIPLGNVRTQSLLKVWNGNKFKDFRSAHEIGEFSRFSLCDNCEKLDPAYFRKGDKIAIRS